MSNPALTWRLRRTNSWSPLRGGSGSQRLAEHVRRHAPHVLRRAGADNALHRTWLAARIA